MKWRTKFLLTSLLIAVIGAFTLHWMINRVYVEPGYSLQLRYKGSLLAMVGVPVKKAKPGHFAEEGEVGVLKEMRGPGRHFYCPLWWETEIVPDKIVMPGQIAVVKSNLGEPLPSGEYLVEGDLGETKHKGILRKSFGPGRYRVHPYAYEFDVIERPVRSENGKHAGFISIPTGYVGVVTNKASNPITEEPKGVLDDVLPPGLYPINGREQEVDIVEIGYREASINVKTQVEADGSVKVDEAGEPVIASLTEGINFPSSDGFPILMDFTAIWGILPDAAPRIIRTFGNIGAVEQKVVMPQIESICRNNGSAHSAVDLLVGESRQKFQEDTEIEFHRVLDDKQIQLLYGLVRHIYIPKEVRQPIQTAFIADELKLTRDQEQITTQKEAELREIEKLKDVEAEKIDADTKKQVAEIIALGQKQVGETEAETIQLVAEIDKETATIEAESTVVIGQAKAKANQLEEEAKAQLFELAVQAFGRPNAYNRYIFADGLPEDLEFEFLYAGEGTLWTDMKNFGIRGNVDLNPEKK